MSKFALFVCLTALVFSILGEWLSDDLSSTALEIGLNRGAGTPLEHLAMVLLAILVIPFVLVLEFPAPFSTLFFALNGAIWACFFWSAWKALHAITRGRRRGQ